MQSEFHIQYEAAIHFLMMLDVNFPEFNQETISKFLDLYLEIEDRELLKETCSEFQTILRTSNIDRLCEVSDVSFSRNQFLILIRLIEKRLIEKKEDC